MGPPNRARSQATRRLIEIRGRVRAISNHLSFAICGKEYEGLAEFSPWMTENGVFLDPLVETFEINGNWTSIRNISPDHPPSRS